MMPASQITIMPFKGTMTAVGGGEPRTQEVFSCQVASVSKNFIRACTRCRINLPESETRTVKTVEFCNHEDHRLNFDSLFKFVSKLGELKKSEFDLALEEDDTIVSDVDYLQCLDEGTELKVLFKKNTVELDGATADVKKLSVTEMNDVEKEDEEALRMTCEKLKRHPCCLYILSQNELQVLSDADPGDVKFYLDVSSLEDAEDLTSQSSNIYVQREEEIEKIERLDLFMRAREWELSQNPSQKNGLHLKFQEGNCNKGGGPFIQFDSMVEADCAVSSKPSSDQADGSSEGRENLLNSLRGKDTDEFFPALLHLREEHYMMLLDNDCAGLSSLNIPKEMMNHTKQFCQERLKLKQKARTVTGYFEPLLEQQAC